MRLQPGLTSIIIPTSNGLDLLTSCVESIRKYTDVPYEIIVVDNASTDGTDAYCISEDIVFISLPVNEGFPKACNLGMKMARGDYLLLLNNDVTVTRNWLSNLLSALNSRTDIGMVGPVTNAASGLQKVELSFEDLTDFQRIAAENNRSDTRRWVEVKRIIGMCLLLKREVLHRVGFLDEAFSPGHYEDDDLCHRACISGYTLLICKDVLVHHRGSASFKRSNPEKLQALIDRNFRLFMDKWNFDPRKYIEERNSKPKGGEVQ
ncbi:glycosyltransferase family 2 protein [Paenibacillus sp. KQZ6P-2]|uniref:Glycosyltransferase family 2 protein n=1 Tax=Paenibacillus mangrovi TaxID=2931978 RepID=A0A9X1WU26_9BACL|nr:glycosyltransferase family 2 protein [Paenibacillus mangrovi]MCJ8013900.1 glycosyltransferase family 2 protein [Paenibacillus mangrovi]